MKEFRLLCCLVFFASAMGNAQVVYAPVPVTKTTSNQIYIHVMPWFETKATNNGAWGQHWKMANKNPDNIDGTGKREIASYYYPLTGPYASSDTNIIEYQLLLMKLAGVDAIAMDWPGTMNVLDYPKNKQNAEAMINRLDKVGLKYTIVYEDNNLNLGNAPNKITQAQADMVYLRDHYFTSNSYVKVNNQPLLLDFGPQAVTSPSDWTTILSVFPAALTFLPLWGDQHVNAAGSNGKGEYSWIYSSNNYLYNYYQSHTINGVRMGSAYIGFKDYYSAGGWGSSQPWTITPSVANFQETLDKAFQYNFPHIQVATWNDYGEGTMIEPTREFGFGCLAYLQQKTGVVGLSQSDLELVYELYQQRLLYAGNPTEQARLNQVFYYIVSLQMAEARSLLLNTPVESPLPDPWRNSDIGTVAAAGSATYSNGSFTARASGADVYGTADEFHYIYQPVTGDATITAKVTAIANTNEWAKAGLMVRETLATGSANAAIVITPSHGTNFQYRAVAAGATTNVEGNSVTVPYWLRLVRSGDAITGFYSPDSAVWTQLSTVNISMASQVYVGMMVTSHNDGTLTNGIFSNVSVKGPVAITSFSPAYGLTGSLVTIKGKYFTGTTAVDFGGTLAASFSVVSDTVITAVVGAGQTGNINIITPGGNASKAGFTYLLCNGQATTLASNISGAGYQWQVNTGTGFYNIPDNSFYAGTTTAVLQLKNVPSPWNGYQYRCVVNGSYSNIFSLQFVNRWLGTASTAWENPANWSCGTVPDAYTDVEINTGTVTVNSAVTIRSLALKPGVVFTVNTGYSITLNH